MKFIEYRVVPTLYNFFVNVMSHYLHYCPLKQTQLTSSYCVPLKWIWSSSPVEDRINQTRRYYLFKLVHLQPHR